MPIGTRRKGQAWQPVEILIPTELALRVETQHQLYDRFHGRTVFGARAQLLTTLIQMWLKDPEQQAADIPRFAPAIRRSGNKTAWRLSLPKDLMVELKARPEFTQWGAFSRFATLMFERWVAISEARLMQAPSPTPKATLETEANVD